MFLTSVESGVTIVHTGQYPKHNKKNNVNNIQDMLTYKTVLEDSSTTTVYLILNCSYF